MQRNTWFVSLVLVLATSVVLVLSAYVDAESTPTLCQRLGGSDAITAVVKSFLTRMRTDDPAKLGRFWQHRGDHGVAREEQLIVDFVQSVTGCGRLYTGRNMVEAHKGMRLSKGD